LLTAEGISTAVINMPSVKPLDEGLVRRVARDIWALVTVENHSILGGFGAAVAEVVVEDFPVPMKRVGIRDEYSESAPNDDLAVKHGLTAADIAEAARSVLKRKKELWPGRVWAGA
jgi:transketolase